MNPSHPQESRAIEGADYIALVIEWEDIDDLGDLGDDDVTQVSEPVRAAADRSRMIATAIGALSVLALAAWGLHRLSAA